MSQRPTDEERAEQLERDLRLSETIRRASEREMTTLKEQLTAKQQELAAQIIAHGDTQLALERRNGAIEALTDALIAARRNRLDADVRIQHLLEENSRLALLKQELTLHVRKLGPMGLELMTLRAELDRVLSGQLTAEEIHGLCHNIQATVPREEFEHRCREYQATLYGPAPAGGDMMRPYVAITPRDEQGDVVVQLRNVEGYHLAAHGNTLQEALAGLLDSAIEHNIEPALTLRMRDAAVTN